MRVKSNGWSDFVFKKGYKLSTLSETERCIKKKGHLPGIPSAASVHRDGVNLGEMNKKLLQKIEELTLHTGPGIEGATKRNCWVKKNQKINLISHKAMEFLSLRLI